MNKYGFEGCCAGGAASAWGGEGFILGEKSLQQGPSTARAEVQPLRVWVPLLRGVHAVPRTAGMAGNQPWRAKAMPCLWKRKTKTAPKTARRVGRKRG